MYQYFKGIRHLVYSVAHFVSIFYNAIRTKLLNVYGHRTVNDAIML